MNCRVRLAGLLLAAGAWNPNTSGRAQSPAAPPPEPAAWAGLSAALHDVSGAPADDGTFEHWLRASLERFAHHPEMTPEELRCLWTQLAARPDFATAHEFVHRRRRALESALARLADADGRLDLADAHARFLQSQIDFPMEDSAQTYAHDAFAQFSVLTAIFSRARLRAEGHGRPADAEWLYLEGRADQQIHRGGELALREFIERTGGRSPYARLAYTALQQLLFRLDRNDEQRAASLASIRDLQDLIAFAERSRLTTPVEPRGREAAGLHAAGEFVVAVTRDGTGATVSVHDWRGRLTARRVFAALEFEAVGGHAGLWVPSVQPLDGCFLIQKFGAYAGRTLLVTTTGQLLEYPGGLHAFDPESRRLFLREDTDADPVTVVLDESLRLVCAAANPDHLRDADEKRISPPARFICLPE